MKWAIGEGYRNDNPAGDALKAVLPKNGNGPKKHMQALPHGDVASAIAAVRECSKSDAAKLAFEFLVFTAARSGEVREATWSEIDLDVRTWTVPALRMKAGREHRVPLSNAAMDILRQAREHVCVGHTNNHSGLIWS